MLGLDHPFHCGGGSSTGDPVVEYLSAVGVGDRPPPFRFLLVDGDLSGDVGDDRFVSEELSRFLVETAEGGQVDTNIDYSPIRPSGIEVTGEKVDEGADTELVHRPGTVVSLEAAGQLVEFSADASRLVGGQTVGMEVGGPVGGRFDNNPTLLNSILISGFGLVGVGLQGYTRPR